MAGNKDLRERRANTVPYDVETVMPFFADRAENAELWDVEGNRGHRICGCAVGGETGGRALT